MAKKKASSIKDYTLKNGEKRYKFQVYLGVDPLTGNQMRTTKRGFKTRNEAKLALARIRLDVANGTYHQERAETYQELYDLWIVQYEKTVEESTFVKTRGYFKNHILPSMGSYKIDKIKIDICQKHFDEWASKLSKARTIKSYAALVLDFGIKRGYLQTNPFTHVETRIKTKKLIEAEDKDENFYNREQLIDFLKCCQLSLHYKSFALLRLLAFTGMRKSEALALTWNDFNIKENELSISKAIGRGERGRLYLKPTKTGSPRTIKVDEDTIAILKEWKRIQKQEYLVLGHNTMKPNQLIFSNSKNELIQLGQVEKWMYSVIKKHSLKKITPHGLRHTHCSLLFEAGASIKEVQDRLGHTDVKTTMDIYTHVSKKAQEGVIQKFVSFLE
ncbi:site-specific integrase [Ureibacillus sinduriensis]|uniref:Integrase n=1 Tax=Ureibacillus sinduriensis BLB-1 = JCM 15800 TaxID=1384057 RepID=A0A0A3HXA9_9BACL|nr:site-specific integrase [Ureibacillus sinduriensis]KGR75840.1 integrase [Ureibacillus sinduriensis BLB-1 = JCM 15800]